ncbi:hypothetical protein OHA77_17680 [Streptosporangium sp. NBC_01639]|uniref:hypothetical protein n=1 Tax=Streptosporangium sp. NBC_01639 TaxID=2975948 RepID=UPI003870AE58|nr:hypothetical protein OHA77_17680 [Streptosporangium sp. NBC_01639]
MTSHLITLRVALADLTASLHARLLLAVASLSGWTPDTAAQIWAGFPGNRCARPSCPACRRGCRQ